MADVTVKKIEDFDNYGNQFFYAGKGLGVTSFGLNVSKLPADWDKYPNHNHEVDNQEEVYIVLEGEATLEADKEKWTLKPGMLTRVGPKQKRKITPGQNGVTMVMVGGVPDTAWSKKKPGKW